MGWFEIVGFLRLFQTVVILRGAKISPGKGYSHVDIERFQLKASFNFSNRFINTSHRR